MHRGIALAARLAPRRFPSTISNRSTVKGPSELKLSITISPDKTVTELKERIAEEAKVEKERQRLIYSGMLPHVTPIAQPAYPR